LNLTLDLLIEARLHVSTLECQEGDTVNVRLGEGLRTPAGVRNPSPCEKDERRCRLPRTGGLLYLPAMRRPSGRTTNFMTGLDRHLPLRDAGARADNRPPEVLSAEHREMVLIGLEQAQNGEFANEEEVRATFSRFRS